MGKLNCWNWKNCGRYPGGPKVKEFGVCPASEFDESDGFLGGREAGRACMYVSGTLCGGKVQGNAESKKKNCMECDYYKSLKREFGSSLTIGRFNKYIDSNVPKKRTPKNQAWVAKNKSGEETADAIQKRYKL